MKKIKEEKNRARLERQQKRSSTSQCVNDPSVNELSTETAEQVVEQVVCEKTSDTQHSVSITESDLQENMTIEENENIDDFNGAEIDVTRQFLKSMLVKPATPEPSVKDQEVQVNTNVFVPSVMETLQNNKQLSTATGLESFELLNTIVEIVKIVTNHKFEGVSLKMDTRERVIMTYVKLKQNISYNFLAILFNCYTSKHCRRIFHEMIKILSKSLKAAISWPSREEISRNLPKCFEGFENVRVILDCTEIFTQHPANLCCQVLTYSNYKGSNTVKVMTGVSPAGNITFVSKVYGGRTTDSHIFQQSDLIKLLEVGDGVMVDRGFLIDEVCKVNQWKCIRPPFLRDKKQFSKEEALLTSKIATARVHIERSNQRIKTFKILGSVMPSTLVPFAEDIFTVICGTINMSAPILRDVKFINQE